MPASGYGRIYFFLIDKCSILPINIPISDDVIRHSHVFLGSNKNSSDMIVGVECWQGGERQDILFTKVDVGNQSAQVLHQFSWSEATIFNLWEAAVSPDDTKILILVRGTKVGSNDRVSEVYVLAIASGALLLVKSITAEEEEKYHQCNGYHYENEAYWIEGCFSEDSQPYPLILFSW